MSVSNTAFCVFELLKLKTIFHFAILKFVNLCVCAFIFPITKIERYMGCNWRIMKESVDLYVLFG